ncbi:MAG: NUDIX hydrolase [Bacilli bacterium]|nr:NUDIX hydrolase [Bacilli bacterium]
MKRYLEQIINYKPSCIQEINDKKLILECIENYKDRILTREIEIAHLTSSALILNDDFSKILMAYHNIYKSWAWTGGHVDGEEDLYEVALREAKEEVGATNLIPLTDEIVSLEILPVYGHMKRGKYVSCHLHLNVTYVFIANENDHFTMKEDENSGVMWVREKELEKYSSEPEMIEVYRKIIKAAFKIKEERKIL